MSYEENRRVIPGYALRAALFLFFLWVARSLLVPLALAAIFAVLLHPWHVRLCTKLHGRSNLSSLILTLGATVLVILPLIFVVTEALSTINDMLSGDLDPIAESLEGMYIRVMRLARKLDVGAQDTRRALTDALQQAATMFTGFLASAIKSVPEYLLDLFLFLIGLYYFMRDGRPFVRWIRRALPFKNMETRKLFDSIREAVHGAIVGTIATAFVQSGLTIMSLLIFDVPGAFLLGVLAGILSFVPILGTVPVTGGAALYLFLDDRLGAAIGMVIAAFVVGTSDNIVRPWVQSARGRMHPLLGLIGIFGGLATFGPFGIFVGPVVGAMAIWTLDTNGGLRPGKSKPEEHG
jgi:predicted PurR-regulated permease PerM